MPVRKSWRLKDEHSYQPAFWLSPYHGAMDAR